MDSFGIHLPGQIKGLPSVTIAREPRAWLYSYYRRIQYPIGLELLDGLYDFRPADTFEEFWTKAHHLIPEIFAHYAYSTHVLRTEELAGDTIRLFAALGVPCDPAYIRAKPPKNVTR